LHQGRPYVTPWIRPSSVRAGRKGLDDGEPRLRIGRCGQHVERRLHHVWVMVLSDEAQRVLDLCVRGRGKIV
jgi:hypothetical protein